MTLFLYLKVAGLELATLYVQSRYHIPSCIAPMQDGFPSGGPEGATGTNAPGDGLEGAVSPPPAPIILAT